MAFRSLRSSYWAPVEWSGPDSFALLREGAKSASIATLEVFLCLLKWSGATLYLCRITLLNQISVASGLSDNFGYLTMTSSSHRGSSDLVLPERGFEKYFCHHFMIFSFNSALVRLGKAHCSRCQILGVNMPSFFSSSRVERDWARSKEVRRERGAGHP